MASISSYPMSFLFPGLVSLLFLCSCAKESCKSEIIPDQPQVAVCNMESKAAMIGSYRDYMVSQEDIESYVHFLNSNRNKDDKRGDVISVSPYEYEGEPAYYALNYENGWDLISSDKRGPIVLGRSETGSFDYDSLIPPQQAWIDCLCDDIYSRRHFEDEYYGKLSAEAREKESSCIEQWLMATANPDYIELFSGNETKTPPVDISGHWEVFDTFTETSSYDSGHMTVTLWEQRDPFNAYCPYKSNSQTERAPAGCVAIAAAQELYYLHNKIGKPVSSPSLGYCIGNVNNYVSSFGTETSTTWNTMNNASDNFHYAALLIGSIGSLVSMHYGNSGSYAHPDDLPNSVFSHFDIECVHQSYDSNLLNTSLTQKIPVILSAFRINTNEDSWIAGHCFIADRCKQTVTRYYTIYQYVYDNNNTMHPIPPDNRTELTYTHRELYEIGFNWGYGFDDTSCFAPSGSWLVDGLNYRYNRKMIYGFE